MWFTCIWEIKNVEDGWSFKSVFGKRLNYRWNNLPLLSMTHDSKKKKKNNHDRTSSNPVEVISLAFICY